MRTSSRASARAPSACGRSPTRRSSWSHCTRPRSCAGPSPSPTCSRSSGSRRSRKGFAKRERSCCRVATAVTTDEIYERYLRKAITEINRLSHEIAQAADGAPTALPTGHPLANIFLLKYGPQAQELQEGVAFHGRAGSALIKSLQRLHVDPMEVYGTNCVKFAGCDPATAASWLAREVRIVQPRLVVTMGDDAREFLNAIHFPLADELG